MHVQAYFRYVFRFSISRRSRYWKILYIQWWMLLFGLDGIWRAGREETHLFQFVALVEIRHLPRAEHAVHYFEELLLDHLRVVEEERGRFVVHACFHVEDLQILAELA